MTTATVETSTPVTTVKPHLLDGVKKTILQCGATVYFNKVEDAPRVALNVYIPGGNCIESVPGQQEMIDRLLMKGTFTKTAEQIAIALDSSSLEAGFDTRRDYSVLSSTFMPEELTESIEFLSDLLFYSTLEELPKESEKMAGEIKMALDTPKAVAGDLLTRHLFNGLPYGVSTSVVQEWLDRIGRVDALFVGYQQAYKPNRFVLSVAGNVDEDSLLKTLEEAFQLARPKGTALESGMGKLLKEHTLTENRVFTKPWEEAAQAQIFQAWLTPAATHADYPALVVLDNILGSAGLTARLFLELRDKQGLAYNVRSSLNGLKHRGSFSLYIGTEPKNVQRCLDGFAEEIRKLIEIPVEADELEAAKRNLIGRRAVFTETTSQLAHWVGAGLMMGHTVESLKTQEDAIKAVTAADIMRVAKTYLSKPSYTTVVGPASCLPKSV